MLGYSTACTSGGAVSEDVCTAMMLSSRFAHGLAIDFQYKKTRLEAEELMENSRGKIKEGSLLYIATDEHDKSFFKPFRAKYDLVFLDDFKHLLKGVNTNYYG